MKSSQKLSQVFHTPRQKRMTCSTLAGAVKPGSHQEAACKLPTWHAQAMAWEFARILQPRVQAQQPCADAYPGDCNEGVHVGPHIKLQQRVGGSQDIVRPCRCDRGRRRARSCNAVAVSDCATLCCPHAAGPGCCPQSAQHQPYFPASFPFKNKQLACTFSSMACCTAS